MLRRPTPWLQRNDVCWRCQWRLAHRYQTGVAIVRDPGVVTSIARLPQRALYATASRARRAAVATELPPPTVNPAILDPSRPIRDRLTQWQEEYGGPNEEELKAFENFPAPGEVSNYADMRYSDAGAEEDVDDDIGRNDPITSEGETTLTVETFLRPGDVAEIRMSGREPVLAVFIQQLDHRAQFFTSSGRWAHAKLNQLAFSISRCISPTLVEALRPYLPTKPEETTTKDATIHAPSDIAAPVVQALQELGREAEDIYRRNASVLDGAYSVLADQSRTRMMTLEQTARTLLAPQDPQWKPTGAVLLAIRKAIFRNTFRFAAKEQTHRLTNVFSIRPKVDVELVETVHDWIREYQEHQALLTKSQTEETVTMSDGAVRFTRFVEKARRIIALSRQYRDPLLSFVGPNKVRQQSSSLRTEWGEEFDSADKKFVQFLVAWALQGQFQRTQGLYSACCFLVESIGLYTRIPKTEASSLPRNDGIESGLGHLVLQELGVIGPHENKTIYDENLMLPTVRMSRNLELLNSKAELTRRSPDFRDAMSHLRRDWGGLEVYCIDDADAQEIDDGVSIEEIDGKPGECWLHVHVANPTAFFDKTHVLSGLAAHMAETVYTPERSYPMLPAWATQKYFSLDRNRPVLTFSTRLDSAGQAVERKIQPGIVRKLTNLSYSQLREILGEPAPPVAVKLVVGGPLPSETASPTHLHTPLPSNKLRELRKLADVARKLHQRRLTGGGVQVGRTEVGVRVFGNASQTGYPFFPLSIDRSRIIHGDPTIVLTVAEGAGVFAVNNTFSSADVVAECMIAACETAGIWCSERNIPVVFRGTIENPRMDVMPLAQLQKQVIGPHLAKHGNLSRDLTHRLMAAYGKGAPSTTSIPHSFLGVKSYVKVTSPLRRFSDMIAHWQIEAALRYEAATGEKFRYQVANSSARAVLPFSQRQMHESLISLYPREQFIRMVKRQANEFWISLAFLRAYYYKEAELPDVFQVTVAYVPPGGKMGQAFTMGYLNVYSLQVAILDYDDAEIKTDDVWECVIKNVNPERKSIAVVATKLISRVPDE